MLLNIKYDLEKDIENYKIIANTKYKGGDSKVLAFFTKKFAYDFSDNNLTKFIEGFVKYNKFDLRQKLLDIQTLWLPVENNVKTRLDKIFNYDYPQQELTAYLTTNDRCGLGQNYFFVTAYSNEPLRIICHELLHFYTYHVFDKKLREMEEKKRYDIKESLTELLNLELSDLIERPEIGYLGHEKLRQLVIDSWKVNRDIITTFDKLSEEYLNNI
ncbi:MAG: hypothetical protein V1846_04545 [Candidatus Komeilibacteria bacterium]